MVLAEAPVGEVVRLQVHPRPVVVDERYDPSPLLVTDRVAATSRGLVGRSGTGWVMDLHHADHPLRRRGRLRALSVGFTAAYELMRARFGDPAALGVAAENIIVSADRLPGLDDLSRGLVVRSAQGGELRLGDAMVATPCREFTSFLLGLPRTGTDDEISEDRDFLRRGMRGFIFSLDADEPFEISLGDEVFLAP
jgi:hypothetical protein